MRDNSINTEKRDKNIKIIKSDKLQQDYKHSHTDIDVCKAQHFKRQYRIQAVARGTPITNQDDHHRESLHPRRLRLLEGRASFDQKVQECSTRGNSFLRRIGP